MSPTGAVIMSIFAAIWWMVGTHASGHGSIPMYLLPVVITLTLVIVAKRRARQPDPTSPEEHARQGRLVGWASGAEGIAILVAVNVLANVGRQDWTAPIVAVIVGLHFVPLALWLPARVYYATGVLLVAIGFAGFLLADPAARIFGVSVAAAGVLWLTALLVLRVSARAPLAAQATAGG